jgi:hypothetical protein
LRARHSPLFGITAVLMLAEMLPHTRLASFLARPGRRLFQSRPDAVSGSAPFREDKAPTSVASCRLPVASSWWRLDWTPALIPAGVILLAASLQATGVRAPVLGRGWVKLDPKHWPVELLPELRQIQRDHPQGVRIFNNDLFGGFLIYHTPGLKVFIDDRCELYGDDWMLQFSQAMFREPERIQQWSEEYDLEYALVVTETAFDHYLERSPNWTRVKRTAAATLFKRVPKNDATAQTRA